MIYKKRENDCDVSHRGPDSRNGFEGQMDVLTSNVDEAHGEGCQWRLAGNVKLRRTRLFGSVALAIPSAHERLTLICAFHMSSII